MVARELPRDQLPIIPSPGAQCLGQGAGGLSGFAVVAASSREHRGLLFLLVSTGTSPALLGRPLLLPLARERGGRGERGIRRSYCERHPGMARHPLVSPLAAANRSVLALSTALSVPPLADPKDKDYHKALLCVCARGGRGWRGSPLPWALAAQGQPGTDGKTLDPTPSRHPGLTSHQQPDIAGSGPCPPSLPLPLPSNNGALNPSPCGRVPHP